VREIDKIIVHCSATREGQDIDVETIRQWHTSPPRNWSDIGYHYVIYLDGTIAPGRPEERQGAHCKGNNKTSIGVCYVGGVEKDGKTPKDTRTGEQKAALAALLLELKSVYCDAVIHGHRDFSNKACPSFDATEEYAWISSYYDEEEV
tara:strand:- start:17 stop:460 length:444 start_codon:yes stop_codon:yes gene_type:complete